MPHPIAPDTAPEIIPPIVPTINPLIQHDAALPGLKPKTLIDKRNILIKIIFLNMILYLS